MEKIVLIFNKILDGIIYSSINIYNIDYFYYHTNVKLNLKN